MMRENTFLMQEIRDIVIADAVLILAMTLVLCGGIFSITSNPSSFVRSFVYYIPIVAVAATLVFVLHELMHKFVAQHYGAIAGFKTNTMGLMITLITGACGFLLGIPGATMIYAHSFDKRQNGLVSLAGPLTNFAIFGACLAIFFVLAPASTSYLYTALSLTLFISILLAFFNMLPIFPLDGSKVLAWNKPIYFGTICIIFVLMMLFTPIPIYVIILMVIVALFFSLFYRRAF